MWTEKYKRGLVPVVRKCSSLAKHQFKMKALISALSLAFFAFSALAAPEPSPESAPAATTEKRDFDFNFGLDFWFNTPAAGALPKLKLPYGTWQASSYDSANDVRLDPQYLYRAPELTSHRFIFSRTSDMPRLRLGTSAGHHPPTPSLIPRYKMGVMGIFAPRDLHLVFLCEFWTIYHKLPTLMTLQW